jgi:uncharacterized membrane protein YgcG
MRRVSLTCLALVGLTFVSTSALAGGDGWNAFWHRVHTDFYRNNTWPQPFEAATGRNASRSTFRPITARRCRARSARSLHSETQRLNTAGELLVKWIMTQAPVHRRAVFVLKGDNPEATTARVESVQTAVAKYASGQVCPVLLTDTEPSGSSAAYVDSMTQQFNSTIPAPRLTSGDKGGGGGSGGSGNGSGSGGGK